MKTITLSDQELKIILDKLDDGDAHDKDYIELLKRLIALK